MRLNFIKKRAIEQFVCQQKTIVSWLSAELKLVFITSINEEAKKKILEKFTEQVHLLSDQDQLEVSNQIYHIGTEFCANEICNKTKAGIDLIGEMISILISFVNSSCIQKKINDRYLDIKGRLLLNEFESGFKNFAVGKNSQTPAQPSSPFPISTAIPLSSIVVSNSNTTTTLLFPAPNSATEFSVSVESWASWMNNSANGTFNEILSSPNAAGNANASPKLTYQSGIGLGAYGILSGVLAALEKQYPQSNIKILALISNALFPLLYKFVESSVFDPNALQMKEGLYNFLFMIFSSLLSEYALEKAQKLTSDEIYKYFLRCFTRCIPILLALSVVYSADNPVDGLMGYGSYTMMYLISSTLLQRILPVQASEAPESIPLPTPPTSALNAIGTFHERSARNQERMIPPVRIQLVEPSHQEMIYSEISEVNESSFHLSQGKEEKMTDTIPKQSTQEGSDYMDMNKPQSQPSSSFYTLPKKPKPVKEGSTYYSVPRETNSTERDVCGMKRV